MGSLPSRGDALVRAIPAGDIGGDGVRSRIVPIPAGVMRGVDP